MTSWTSLPTGEAFITLRALGRVALTVIKARKEADHNKMEDNNNEVGDGTGALTADQTPDMDKAIEILVQNAMEEFGFVPCNVYSIIVHLPRSRVELDTALDNFSYAELKSIVEAFTKKSTFNFTSHHVIAICPIHIDLGIDIWRVDFKSN